MANHDDVPGRSKNVDIGMFGFSFPKHSLYVKKDEDNVGGCSKTMHYTKAMKGLENAMTFFHEREDHIDSIKHE